MPTRMWRCVSLSKATSQMRDALLNIATLAKEAEKPKAIAARKLALDATAKPVWSLALDEIQDRGEDLAPACHSTGRATSRAPSVLQSRLPRRLHHCRPY